MLGSLSLISCWINDDMDDSGLWTVLVKTGQGLHCTYSTVQYRGHHLG